MRRMHRTAFLLMFLALALALYGCGIMNKSSCEQATGIKLAECNADEGIDTDDLSFCDKIPASADYATNEESAHILEHKNRCYQDIARDTGNRTTCDSVRPGLVGYHPDICKYQVAQSTRHASDCLAVSERGYADTKALVYSRATCLEELNSTLAEKGCPEATDEECFITLGALKNDLSNCRYFDGCEAKVEALRKLIAPAPLSDVERFRKTFGPGSTP